MLVKHLNKHQGPIFLNLKRRSSSSPPEDNSARPNAARDSMARLLPYEERDLELADPFDPHTVGLFTNGLLGGNIVAHQEERGDQRTAAQRSDDAAQAARDELAGIREREEGLDRRERAQASQLGDMNALQASLGAQQRELDRRQRELDAREAAQRSTGSAWGAQPNVPPGEGT